MASTTDTGTATRLLLHQGSAGQFIPAQADGAGRLIVTEAYQGVEQIMPGVAAVAGRGIAYTCTAGGTATLIFSDGSTLPIEIVAGTGLQILPFACIGVECGSGVSATFWTLK